MQFEPSAAVGVGRPRSGDPSLYTSIYRETGSQALFYN